jgi:hypothetical protein
LFQFGRARYRYLILAIIYCLKSSIYALKMKRL